MKNWTDLRFLLAIQRSQTLAKAAKLLSVDATTVSRRLGRLQQEIGAQLIERQSDGTYTLTKIGEAVASDAELIAQKIDIIGRKPDLADGAVYGTVRLTSVPIIVNRFLVRQLSPLLKENPELEVELIAESRDYSLTRREADLAIRLSRPVDGGNLLKARRVADWSYGLFGAVGLESSRDNKLPLILYDDTLAHMPQAKWIAREARTHEGGVLPLRVHDAETALEAAQEGLGLAVLPDLIASSVPQLRRSKLATRHPLLTCEVWLVGHADQLKTQGVSCVSKWIDRVFQKGTY